MKQEVKDLEYKIQHWIDRSKGLYGDDKLTADIYLRLYAKQYRVLTGRYYRVK